MIKDINRNILTLSQKSQPANKSDQEIGKNLIDTLAAHRSDCVGMAANMIGVNKRIIVVQMGPIPVLMYNPQIIDRSESYQTKEGCLSLDGQRKTTRYQNIKVKFDNKNFEKQIQDFTGFVAQIIQHEIDHCDGIVI